jgi:heme-degrading monooxygenase HmoA
MSVYTVGIWIVKEGREQDFERAWEALGQWTVEEGFATHGTLVRDRANPRRYVSFGPWGSAEHVERWRASAGYTARLDAITDLLESFEPGTYDSVLSVS